ncbi:unnamed protein product [Kuraishia capsulata CBS 1993]|uniref:Uncharacterized protein n=1 Tax=Kuraishia capsulata CBS 1993 TaxID=1382522 RepID=W6MHU5_9ASCO|nr:uncharacterized protein KUCA_T00001561001 [Kuraishia capsulata CBS 1993]CDK25591.1 unnamed protein product [Kuraishia capsulata CBS 1993]
MSKVWFIYGSPQGIGHELVEYALGQGDKVITNLHSTSLQKLGAMVVNLNVNSDEANVKEAIDAAYGFYNRIDVVVNNTGYVSYGALEEVPASDLETQFQANVFAPARVNRCVLPYLRKQKSGLILNVSSRSAYEFTPCLSYYSASKAALSQLSVCLDNEISHFGLRSIAIEPGMVRKSASCRNLDGVQDLLHNHDPTITDYAPLVEKSRTDFTSWEGKEIGDPAKLVYQIFNLAHGIELFKDRRLPSRLVLGSDCISAVHTEVSMMTQMLSEWGAVIRSTDQKDWTPPPFTQ